MSSVENLILTTEGHDCRPNRTYCLYRQRKWSSIKSVSFEIIIRSSISNYLIKLNFFFGNIQQKELCKSFVLSYLIISDRFCPYFFHQLRFPLHVLSLHFSSSNCYLEVVVERSSLLGVLLLFVVENWSIHLSCYYPLGVHILDKCLLWFFYN